MKKLHIITGTLLALAVVQAVTTSTGPVVNLSWTAPTSGPMPTGYIAYSIAAVATTLLAPQENQPTTSVSMLVRPSTNKMPALISQPEVTLALAKPMQLMAVVKR